MGALIYLERVSAIHERLCVRTLTVRIYVTALTTHTHKPSGQPDPASIAGPMDLCCVCSNLTNTSHVYVRMYMHMYKCEHEDVLIFQAILPDSSMEVLSKEEWMGICPPLLTKCVTRRIPATADQVALFLHQDAGPLIPTGACPRCTHCPPCACFC